MKQEGHTSFSANRAVEPSRSSKVIKSCVVASSSLRSLPLTPPIPSSFFLALQRGFEFLQAFGKILLFSRLEFHAHRADYAIQELARHGGARAVL